ncbi:hypothetical protein PIB30_068250 [Stylosanthes scabra]|uniref:Ubiquitin-like protease family profile domain-containing protein n=1 Tax=Stylosanthes scabra TaxID=79078 RepID=A0ABU6UNF3_9FABA|nr:hypothetical protein [Stylosanthes scabra]
MQDKDPLGYIDKDKMKSAIFDCGVYVLKYMKIITPSLLEKNNFTIPAWNEEELQQFREECGQHILLDIDNWYRQEILDIAHPNTR